MIPQLPNGPLTDDVLRRVLQQTISSLVELQQKVFSDTAAKVSREKNTARYSQANLDDLDSPAWEFIRGEHVYYSSTFTNNPFPGTTAHLFIWSPDLPGEYVCTVIYVLDIDKIYARMGTTFANAVAAGWKVVA